MVNKIALIMIVGLFFFGHSIAKNSEGALEREFTVDYRVIPGCYGSAPLGRGGSQKSRATLKLIDWLRHSFTLEVDYRGETQGRSDSGYSVFSEIKGSVTLRTSETQNGVLVLNLRDTKQGKQYRCAWGVSIDKLVASRELKRCSSEGSRHKSAYQCQRSIWFGVRKPGDAPLEFSETTEDLAGGAKADEADRRVPSFPVEPPGLPIPPASNFGGRQGI